MAENTAVDMVEDGVELQQETQWDLVGVASSAKQNMPRQKWVGLHVTSIAIATAAALHFAMYSSVLGVPLYTPKPCNSATPVKRPCRYNYNQYNHLKSCQYLTISVGINFNRLVTIDTGNMLQFSNWTGQREYGHHYQLDDKEITYAVMSKELHETSDFV